MKSHRTFFAIVPDPDGLAFLTEQQDHLKRCGWERHARFTKPELFHVTMRFLGTLEEEAAPSMIEQVRELASRLEPIPYEIERPALFPRVSRARIIAARVVASDALKQLARELESLAVEAGFEPSKHPFKPHITLGRLQKQRRPNLPAPAGSVIQTADQLVLMRSVEDTEGLSYEAVETFELGEKEKSGAQ